MTKNSIQVGIIAFVTTLLLMPLGHSLMILNEHFLHANKFIGATFIGGLGIFLLVVDLLYNSNKTISSIIGLISGVLVWTGWIEFSFVWVAEKLNVPALIENGVVATKPEYLIMMSSSGLLLTVLSFFLFSSNFCPFFNWFQKKLKLNNSLPSAKITKPVSITTFIESIIIIWTFYILLLIVYDKDIAGEKHIATYIVAYGSLLWSMYLFSKLIQFNQIDYAVRYAIPTVIIFWNFIEILGRWNVFKEIWIHPTEHWLEVLLFFIAFLGFLSYYFLASLKKQ